MTEIDLESLWKGFAGLKPAERASMASQVADQLEWLIKAADGQGVAFTEINRAHIVGAMVALRAVAGVDPLHMLL